MDGAPVRRGDRSFMTTSPFDPKAYSQTMAEALDLPLEEAYKPAVEAHLAVVFRLAPLFLDFALADETEPAPIYVVEERP